MQVCKDFESYFVEEVIKEVKKNLLPDDEEKDASLSTMTDYTMDFAVEKIAASSLIRLVVTLHSHCMSR